MTDQLILGATLDQWAFMLNYWCNVRKEPEPDRVSDYVTVLQNQMDHYHGLPSLVFVNNQKYRDDYFDYDLAANLLDKVTDIV